MKENWWERDNIDKIEEMKRERGEGARRVEDREVYEWRGML